MDGYNTGCITLYEFYIQFFCCWQFSDLPYCFQNHHLGDSWEKSEWQNMFSGIQINECSVQQTTDSHLRKHTSFNLELNGLEQRRAATFTPVSREEENVCSHQTCMTDEQKHKVWSEESWWKHTCQLWTWGLYSHSALCKVNTCSKIRCHFTSRHCCKILLDATLTSVFLPWLSLVSYLNQAEHHWDDVECVDSRENASPWCQRGLKFSKECLQHLVESTLPWKWQKESLIKYALCFM